METSNYCPNGDHESLYVVKVEGVDGQGNRIAQERCHTCGCVVTTSTDKAGVVTVIVK